MGKTILFEVNEVPFTIWDRYAGAHPGSAIARLLAGANQFETVTPDKGYATIRSAEGKLAHEQLTPWSTWPTVHRGVANTVHGIYDIGQDTSAINASYPPLWEVAATQGKRVGVFGSLHSYPIPAGQDYAFYVPDPFAAGSETVPDVAESFQAFSLAATRESGRNVGGLDRNAAARFVRDAPRLGLKPKTAVALAKQLAHERLKPEVATRRRAFQSVISFDIFEKLLSSEKPDLATFFANHVAAAMHRYWAAAYPDDYSGATGDAEWRKTYANEIDYAMRAVDNMVGRLLQFCDTNPEYRLVVASSMGQAPTKAKRVLTELAITDQDRFMSRLGVPAGRWSHAVAMFPNYNFFVDEPFRDEFRRALATLRVCGEPLDHREADNGFFSVDFGQPNLDDLTVEFDGATVQASDLGITNMEITDLAMKCADHVPQGALMVYATGSDAPDTSRSSVSTTDIAPAVLAHIGCEVPAHMDPAPIAGLPALATAG